MAFRTSITSGLGKATWKATLTMSTHKNTSGYKDEDELRRGWDGRESETKARGKGNRMNASWKRDSLFTTRWSYSRGIDRIPYIRCTFESYLVRAAARIYRRAMSSSTSSFISFLILSLDLFHSARGFSLSTSRHFISRGEGRSESKEKRVLVIYR